MLGWPKKCHCTQSVTLFDIYQHNIIRIRTKSSRLTGRGRGSCEPRGKGLYREGRLGRQHNRNYAFELECRRTGSPSRAIDHDR